MSRTSSAEEPRKIEGVDCDVCVSEEYLEAHRDLVDDLKRRIDTLDGKLSAASALADDRKGRIVDLKAKLEDSQGRVVELETNRPRRWVWFSGGVAVGAGASVLVFVFVN